MKAWGFDTEDSFTGSEMQCRPVFSDGVLFVTTPKGRLVVDAGTGAEKWSFDRNPAGMRATKFRNRGVTRLFSGVRQFLYAVDGKTGKAVPGFGTQGKVDLRKELGRAPETLSVSNPTPRVAYMD